MIIYLFSIFLSIFTLNPVQEADDPMLEKKALCLLSSLLEGRQKFVKAHAAEYLIWTGHANLALEEFIKEEKLYSKEPKYRIVVWRVLAQAEKDPVRRQLWLNNIYNAYNDMNGLDRTHATETLAKLKQPVSNLFPEVTDKTLSSSDRNLQTYALWASSIESDEHINRNREKFLDLMLRDSDTTIRKISAFILRQLKGLNEQQWERVLQAAISNRPMNELYVTFLATALVTVPTGVEGAKVSVIHDLLIRDVKKYSANQLNELALALAEKGTKEHLKVLEFIMNNCTEGHKPDSDEVADSRASAAYAILKINSRKP